MINQNFTTSFVVDNTAKEVFDAILNPRAWWSVEIEGNTDTIGEVFNYHYEDIHTCKVKVIDLVPHKKIVWHVLENYFKFTQDKTEWVDTKVIFEINEVDGKSQLIFTHDGLVPEYECYEACNDGWTHYVQDSLKKYIISGVGEPNATGKPQTETERKIQEMK